MRLKKIKLRGFKGIKKGLDRDEIELDLSNLNGVITITGPNGAGKTTLAECLQPFRVMPSRKASLRDSVLLRDSWKDLTFEMNGQIYRALVTVDAASVKSDGFLWRNDEPLTTGKVSEYDEQIYSLFGSPELFFQSVFCPQTPESLLSLRPGVRKQFFVEFLGIEKLQDQSVESKKVGDAHTGVIDGLKARRDVLLRELEGLIIIRGAIVEKNQQLNWKVAEVGAAQSTLVDKERELTSLRQTAASTVTAKARIESLQEQRQKLDADTARLLEPLKRSFNKLCEDSEALVSARSKAQAKIKQQVYVSAEELSHELDKLNGLSAATAGYLQYAADKARKLEDYQRQIAELTAHIQGAKNLNDTLKLRPKDAPDELCNRCGLATAALDAGASIKKTQDALRQAKAAADTLKREIEQRRPDGYLEPQNLERKRAELNGQLASAQLQERVAEYSQRLEDLGQSRLDTKIQIDGIEASAEKSRQDINGLIAEASLSLDSGLEARLTSIEDEVRIAREAVLGLVAAAGNLRGSISSLEERLANEASQKAALEAVNARLSTAQKEQAEWHLLAKLCGKDCLQALELDAAAPGITQYGNQLLTQCFGGRFSMSFRTLDEQNREVFDLIVNDERDEHPVNLLLLSGGEKTIILHALRLAMLLYAKERSGRDFKTAFADEMDGQLFPESREEFVTMNRRMMQLGGIEALVLISHSNEVIDRADHRIRFEEGEIRVD